MYVYLDDHTKHQKVGARTSLCYLPLALPLPNSVVRSPFFTQVGTDNEAMNRLLVVQRVSFSIYGIRYTVCGIQLSATCAAMAHIDSECDALVLVVRTHWQAPRSVHTTYHGVPYFTTKIAYRRDVHGSLVSLLGGGEE